jgi:hypothetical protein
MEISEFLYIINTHTHTHTHTHTEATINIKNTLIQVVWGTAGRDDPNSVYTYE